MKCYCWDCAKENEYLVKKTEEKMTIKGYTFTVMQEHAFCASCGADLYPDAVEDGNTERANEAYREACGSITVRDMQRLLEKYQIGANPLSKLLGWGENTIDRQMHHTIPNRACSEKLKSLFDPYEMRKLLHMNKANISNVAYRKAVNAVNGYIGKNDSDIFGDNKFTFTTCIQPMKSVLVSSGKALETTISFTYSGKYIPSDVSVGDYTATVA